MHRLNIDDLTQDVLTGPTYDLMKGTCKSVVELEYHLEEVFKAPYDRLDWHNPERKPYPHDHSKPLPLIQNAQGQQDIPLDYYINNDLKYLKRGSSSHMYTNSITKTKDTDYGQIKWIKDKVSRTWNGLLAKGKWSKQDKQRAHLMINAIDKKLRDRRFMRNIEKFVGGRPYGGDLQLLERTI
ncbi:hypothetical protein Tco_0668365 [Tanacetum coccineum]